MTSPADTHGSGVSTATHYRTATIDGLNIFDRDAVWSLVARRGPVYSEARGQHFHATLGGFRQDGSHDPPNEIRGFLTPESAKAHCVAGVGEPSLAGRGRLLVVQAQLGRPGVA